MARRLPEKYEYPTYLNLGPAYVYMHNDPLTEVARRVPEKYEYPPDFSPGHGHVLMHNDQLKEDYDSMGGMVNLYWERMHRIQCYYLYHMDKLGPKMRITEPVNPAYSLMDCERVMKKLRIRRRYALYGIQQIRDLNAEPFQFPTQLASAVEIIIGVAEGAPANEAAVVPAIQGPAVLMAKWAGALAAHRAAVHAQLVAGQKAHYAPMQGARRLAAQDAAVEEAQEVAAEEAKE